MSVLGWGWGRGRGEKWREFNDVSEKEGVKALKKIRNGKSAEFDDDVVEFL